MWSNLLPNVSGKVTLIKSVLEAIHVFWMSLAYIPKAIINSIRKICTTYLWDGKKDHHNYSLCKWDSLFLPKLFSGWGFKYIHLFSSLIILSWQKWIPLLVLYAKNPLSHCKEPCLEAGERWPNTNCVGSYYWCEWIRIISRNHHLFSK